MKPPGQTFLDQAQAMERELLSTMDDSRQTHTLAADRLTQSKAESPTSPEPSGEKPLDEAALHGEVLRLMESQPPAAPRAAESPLDPVDHLRLCALASETGRTVRETLHDLLHPSLTLAERKLRRK